MGPVVQVVQLPRGPVTGTAVISTLGLSHHVMHSPDSGKSFRIELVMLYRASEGPRNLAGVIQQVATEALRDHHGLSRGDVVGPWGPLRDGATTAAPPRRAPWPRRVPEAPQPVVEARPSSDAAPHTSPGRAHGASLFSATRARIVVLVHLQESGSDCPQRRPGCERIAHVRARGRPRRRGSR